MNEIVVLLPAYNEEKNISELTDKWQDYRDVLKKDYSLDLKILIVNDGSSDGTEKICKELENTYDNFTFINHEKNKGLGMAMKTGIKYIIKNCLDCLYVCVMDCDNTHNPKYIIDMLNKEKETNADIVIASRYQKGAEVKGVPGVRLLTCQGAKLVYSSILHVKNVKDYTCGYRLYKIDSLRKLDARFGDNMIEESGFTCMAELLYKLYSCGCSFEEVPFELRYDLKKGSSKMQVIKTSINSIKLTLRLKRIKKE